MSRAQAEELLERLLAVSADERAQLLETLTSENPPLRSAFEALLAEAPPDAGPLATSGLLDSPLGRQVVEELSGKSAGVGDWIGSVRLDERLGRGGMGTVFRGFDTKLERPVAVKTVHAEHRLDPVAAARFHREATLLSRLNHPGICQVYDLVERPEADYLLLELVEGETLRDHLARELPFTRRLDLARGLVEALAAAHERGIVHRDLKPDNVMVTPSGSVKVLDFGIARLVGGEPDLPGPIATPATTTPRERGDTGSGPRTGSDPGRGSFRTEHGLVVGTVAYMSPEQAAGEPVTEASDLYSLGLLLQEIFTGKPAYPKLPPALLAKRVLRAQPEPIEGLDRDLANLIRQLLSLDPAERPSAAVTAASLARLAGKPERRRRVLLAGAGLALVAAAVTGAFVLLRPGRLCGQAAAPMEQAWSPAVAERVRAAVAGGSGGSEAARRVTARLDGYAGRWVAVRREACAATHQRGEQSTDLLDRRMACLDRALASFRALTDLLATGEAGVTARAVDAADALPPLSVCSDRELLAAPVAPPSDPAGRAALASLDQQLAIGFAALEGGQLRSARELAEKAEAGARALGFRPAQARAHYLRGRLERAEGHFAVARDLLQEALHAAVAGGDEEWTVRALAELVFVDGSDLADLVAARRWQGLGEAMLERVGQDSAVAGDLYHASGTVRMWDDPAASRELLERAVRIRQALHDGSAAIVRSRVNLAEVDFVVGDFAASERMALEAVELARGRLGDAHPYTAVAMGNVGSARLEMGNTQGARQAFQQAREIQVAAKGADSFDVATADINLAQVDVDEGRHGAALRRARAAQPIFEASLPAGHPYFAYLDFVTGQALTGVGRAHEAVSVLERAVKLRKEQVVLPTELPQAELALARALWADGQRARATTVAREAEAHAARIPWAARVQTQIRDWLAHPGAAAEPGQPPPAQARR